jgi:hypothetical protein
LVYNESFWSDSFPENLEEASNEAYEATEAFMSLWARSVLMSYSSEGIQMKIPFGDQSLFSTDIDWATDIGNGISRAEMRISLNLTAEGFSGWEADLISSFVLQMNIPEISEGETVQTFNFSLWKWKGESGVFITPVFDLTKGNVNVSQFIGGKWNRTEISELTYLGGGLYKVTLKEALSYGKRVKMLVLVPGDEVLVGASNIVGLGMPWNTLYYLSPYYLSPQYLVSSPSHLIQPYSHGKGKSDILLRTRQPTPYDIPLEDYVIIIMSLRRDPSKAEIAWVDLTFRYMEEGKDPITITSSRYESTEFGGTEGLISAFKDGIHLEIPEGQRMIPKNSTIYLLVTVQLSETPYGTTMVECGFRFDSRIQLRIPPSIKNVSYSYNAVARNFSVEANVTDIGFGGSEIGGAIFQLSNATWTSGYVYMSAIKGRFGIDQEVRVNGTMTLPKGFLFGNYTLEIEAWDVTGSIARREIQIQNFDPKKDSGQSFP